MSTGSAHRNHACLQEKMCFDADGQNAKSPDNRMTARAFLSGR